MKHIVLTGLLAATGLAAQAQVPTFVDRARVQSAEPQYEQVQVPRQECSSQRMIHTPAPSPTTQKVARRIQVRTTPMVDQPSTRATRSVVVPMRMVSPTPAACGWWGGRGSSFRKVWFLESRSVTQRRPRSTCSRACFDDM